MEPILAAHNIVAGYCKQPVLHDISLNFDKEDHALLIGPNGCGKTTLLKVLGGALSPNQGCVFYNERDVTKILGERRIRLGIGYLLQTNNTFPSLSVEENLLLSLWHNDDNFPQRRDWVLSIFPMLKGKLRHRAGRLSGGERQALAIAMVLMRPAEILLLDEPTAGLSPKAASAILEALREVQENLPVATIIVEHKLRIVHPLVSKVHVLKEGQVVAKDLDPSILLDPDRLQRYFFS